MGVARPPNVEERAFIETRTGRPFPEILGGHVFAQPGTEDVLREFSLNDTVGNSLSFPDLLTRRRAERAEDDTDEEDEDGEDGEDDDEDGGPFVFLLTTRVGGVGVNLPVETFAAAAERT